MITGIGKLVMAERRACKMVMRFSSKETSTIA